MESENSGSENSGAARYSLAEKIQARLEATGQENAECAEKAGVDPASFEQFLGRYKFDFSVTEIEKIVTALNDTELSAYFKLAKPAMVEAENGRIERAELVFPKNYLEGARDALGFSKKHVTEKAGVTAEVYQKLTEGKLDRVSMDDGQKVFDTLQLSFHDYKRCWEKGIENSQIKPYVPDNGIGAILDSLREHAGRIDNVSNERKF